MRELILGGVKSGKSCHAEAVAAASGATVVYLATARAGDAEMAERIARHRARRPAGWTTREVGDDLAGALAAEAAAGRCLLVDCLTLWLSGLIERPSAWRAARTALLEGVTAVPGTLLLVSNEVGDGVVPADPLSRRFVDEAGSLHQALAARCERVTRVTAGLPQRLKDAS